MKLGETIITEMLKVISSIFIDILQTHRYNRKLRMIVQHSGKKQSLFLIVFPTTGQTSIYLGVNMTNQGNINTCTGFSQSSNQQESNLWVNKRIDLQTGKYRRMKSLSFQMLCITWLKNRNLTLPAPNSCCNSHNWKSRKVGQTLRGQVRHYLVHRLCQILSKISM